MTGTPTDTALRRSTETDKPGVREAALEEAAKVAETITQDGDYDLEPEATVAASVAGKQIATAIRALRTPPASPTEAGEATANCMWTDKPCTCGGGNCEQVSFGATE